MGNIKGVHTAPELLVRKYLFKYGFRFSLHRKNLPGTPDIVLSKYKAVIFVSGCFWHGHIGCIKSALPKTRVEFWETKIFRNKERDNLNMRKLEKLGWKVIVIFQCELKKKDLDQTMGSVIERIVSK
ncbi:very short patch repair endonuclease [Mucilaginibacter sp. SMC90]|uniref:very short patch repair endonuclease n=1 Tax=Mucilaginibacter sp. SMC90 TaxID=2929803 RepID=UPI001FB34EC8|nr:very short patch repair endonuclease [Mucilaginibacter sp. SMC90]UOE48502.1 very short patch repair endonuclease [Mucilaginibacter sp. SMC90]